MVYFNDGNNAEGQNYRAKPNFHPFYSREKNAKQSTHKFFDSKKKGYIVVKLGKGFILKLKYKFYNTKNNSDFVAVMDLVDGRGRIVARPIIFSDGNAVYVNDLIKKRKR